MPYGKFTLPANTHRARWKTQFNLNTNNLNPRQFDPKKLAVVKFYSATGFRDLDGRNTDAIEKALLDSREVVWDFDCGGDMKGTSWKYTKPLAPKSDAHSMLIIGYDRTDPKNPYFIAKNSWKGQQLVKMSYDYVKNYGRHGATIIGVEKPRLWSEIGFMGRWFTQLEGKQGVLDVYHLPGINQMNFDYYHQMAEIPERLVDRRVGTFFVDGDPKKAFRVNGEFTPKGLKLIIDWDKPNASYDNAKGKAYEVQLSTNRLSLTGAKVNAVRLESKEAFAIDLPDWKTLPELTTWKFAGRAIPQGK
jgi:hypothetical protein